ncbi:MAG: hypothetical protein WCC60_20075 [Ilumatobacteraceae bacterium]
MNLESSRSTTPRFAMASLILIVLFAGCVIAPRVASMNDISTDDNNPVVPFAVLFIVATIVPLAGVQRSPQWRKLAVIQCGAALLAGATLFGFRPSGDGLYVLPIAAASIVTTVASIGLTVRVGRAAAPSRAEHRRADRVGEAPSTTALPASAHE